MFLIERTSQEPKSEKPIGQGINWMKMGVDKQKKYRVISDEPVGNSSMKGFFHENRMAPHEEIREVPFIESCHDRTVKIGTEMDEETTIKMIAFLRQNVDVFA